MDRGLLRLANPPASFGLDVGSLFIKVVGLGPDGRPETFDRIPHDGDPRPHLDRWLARARESGGRIGLSGGGAPVGDAPGYDPIVCLQAAVRACHPEARNILEVGASHLVLVRLDDEGRIASVHGSSLCASGTGSFLDAQAARMGIGYDGPETCQPVADPPSIATRCAVFAKSDLIYRQTR